jgi:ammonia channel protein AmtB
VASLKYYGGITRTVDGDCAGKRVCDVQVTFAIITPALIVGAFA